MVGGPGSGGGFKQSLNSYMYILSRASLNVKAALAAALLDINPGRAQRSQSMGLLSHYFYHLVNILVATAREVDKQDLVPAKPRRHFHGPGQSMR